MTQVEPYLFTRLIKTFNPAKLEDFMIKTT